MHTPNQARKPIAGMPTGAVMGCLVTLLGITAIGMFASPRAASLPREQGGNYFPSGAVNDFEQRWYGSHLFAMDEPVLGAPRADASNGVTDLRVLVLPTWGHPVAVRYTFDRSTTKRRAIKLCGAGGYEPGRVGIDQTTTLTPSESAGLLASLDASGFWSMPAKDIRGLDGSEVIVEAVRNGIHRVRARWTPEYDTGPRGLAGFVGFYTDALKRGGVETGQGDVDPACKS